MTIVDREIDEIVSWQEMQKVRELGELLEQRNTLLSSMPSVKFAKVFSEKLRINYGSALCLVFWLEELLKMASDAPKNKNIYSEKQNKQRATQLGRLIQIAGSKKALKFCFSKIPEYAKADLKAVWDADGIWKKRRS